MLTINQHDFLKLVDFVHKNYGINLSQKKHLIESRLASTIMDMGYSSFTDYVSYIVSTKNQGDLEVMLNKLTTNHTFFMREKTHFDLFRDTILPELERTKTNKSLSIWSAGCSSGQEPYTLSMIMLDYFGSKASAWDTRILATDISQRAMGVAMAATYTDDEIKDLPPKWLSQYMTKSGVGPEAKYTFVPKIRNNVVFREFNLMNPIKFKTNFDVIFCRNVMIYFNQQTKEELVQRFYDATNPNGYLLIGHSENLNKETCQYKYVMPATYHKK